MIFRMFVDFPYEFVPLNVLIVATSQPEELDIISYICTKYDALQTAGSLRENEGQTCTLVCIPIADAAACALV